MSKDYRDHIPGEYPEPEDRMNAKDFPPVDRLFVYGEDFYMPESMDDLRYEYSFPSGVELKDLKGRKVPPLGLSYISKAGGGGKQGFVYRPGTFFEDKVTIGKPLGKTVTELTLAREDKKNQAILDNMSKALTEHGHKIDGNSSSEVLGTLAYVLTDKLLDDKAPVKELRLWYGDTLKILTSKEETIKDNKEKLALELGIKSMDVLKGYLDGIDKAIADQKGETIELYDVSEDGLE